MKADTSCAGAGAPRHKKARRKPFRPFNPNEGPWLIWSNYWSRWHMRSSTGGAAGYTDDIAHAGIFDEATARQYHDPPPYRRDEAVPFKKAFDKMDARLMALTAERDAFAERIAAAKAIVAARVEAGEPEGSSTLDISASQNPQLSREKIK